MLRRADIRAMHFRLVLRRVYSIKWHRRMTEPNPLNAVLRAVPPPNMDSEAAARYHRSSQHGR